KAFMAGVLAHLPGLMALTVPSVNSYRRLLPHCWSGAFQTWGLDNREAAIRVPSNFTLPSPTHVEVKTVDASANPYLALGAVIYAGLDGIQRQLPLPDPVGVDPGSLTQEERQRLNIQALPNNLGTAIACLEKDEVLLAALGPDLAKAFIAVRKAEWEVLQGKSLEEEVNLLLTKY
ncbi:MAG: glutamine synthetase, partial [Synechocystis sp.]|nr:glutamine synthetase [Synechocystis sp.]